MRGAHSTYTENINISNISVFLLELEYNVSMDDDIDVNRKVHWPKVHLQRSSYGALDCLTFRCWCIICGIRRIREKQDRLHWHYISIMITCYPCALCEPCIHWVYPGEYVCGSGSCTEGDEFTYTLMVDDQDTYQQEPSALSLLGWTQKGTY